MLLFYRLKYINKHICIYLVLYRTNKLSEQTIYQLFFIIIIQNIFGKYYFKCTKWLNMFLYAYTFFFFYVFIVKQIFIVLFPFHQHDNHQYLYFMQSAIFSLTFIYSSYLSHTCVYQCQQTMLPTHVEKFNILTKNNLSTICQRIHPK